MWTGWHLCLVSMWVHLVWSGGSDDKEFACNTGDPGSILESGGGHGNHSSILAWRIPWIEEPGRLQSMGTQRVRHDWVTNTFTFTWFEGSWVPSWLSPLSSHPFFCSISTHSPVQVLSAGSSCVPVGRGTMRGEDTWFGAKQTWVQVLTSAHISCLNLSLLSSIRWSW